MKQVFFTVLSLCVVLWSPAHGQLLIFDGFDEAVYESGPWPNSDAARDDFLSSSSGDLVIEDFEGFDVMIFDTLDIANGTVSDIGFFTTIRNINTQLSGHNTTGGGDKFMRMAPDVPINTGEPGASLYFSFDPPIAEFGFYGTGLSTDPAIGHRILIDGDNADIIELQPLITAQAGGVGFFGLIDPAGSITSIEIIQFRHVGSGDSGDLFGLDDVYISAGVSIGDINGDGTINLLDVDPFITLLGNGKFQPEADINGDGVVNLLDVDPFIELLAS